MDAGIHKSTSHTSYKFNQPSCIQRDFTVFQDSVGTVTLLVVQVISDVPSIMKVTLLKRGYLIAFLIFIPFLGTNGLTLNLPPRPDDAPIGSQFANVISRVPLTERENWIFAQVMSGNVPNFLRSLVPIYFLDFGCRLSYCPMTD
jgi:hypothetical protein